MPFVDLLILSEALFHNKEKLGFELTLLNSYRLALLASIAGKLATLPSYGYYLQPIARETIRRLVTSA